MSKLWGGRFSKETDDMMEAFHSSIAFDQRLYYWDIQGSLAHAAMLTAQGIISSRDGEAIQKGLEGILTDIEEGRVTFSTSDEDIHMNIERLLIERIGEAGKRLHTGRSRNDQVALDVRLFLRHEVATMKELLLHFIGTLLDLAETHKETIMPGYTHLQRAQPITFGHHMLAYVEMFVRDYEALTGWETQHDVMPLGSGALAGTTFPLDRWNTAKLLGFNSPCYNSLDGVSDRDFVLDYLYSAARSMMHLSRFSEEIILWNTQEFAFVTLDDAYSTGSSIMPQKKNPDVAELVRGKCGRTYGNLMAFLTTMKGIPLAYNKDMQEDKECLFDSVDTWKTCLLIFDKMLATMTVNKERTKAATKEGFTNATDMADYLVKKGMPFRDAHHVVGQLVAHCIGTGQCIEELGLHELQGFATIIEDDVYDYISVEACVKGRNTFGGPSLQAIEAIITLRTAWWKAESDSCKKKVRY